MIISYSTYPPVSVTAEKSKGVVLTDQLEYRPYTRRRVVSSSQGLTHTCLPRPECVDSLDVGVHPLPLRPVLLSPAPQSYCSRFGHTFLHQSFVLGEGGSTILRVHVLECKTFCSVQSTLIACDSYLCLPPSVPQYFFLHSFSVLTCARTLPRYLQGIVRLSLSLVFSFNWHQSRILVVSCPVLTGLSLSNQGPLDSDHVTIWCQKEDSSLR